MDNPAPSSKEVAAELERLRADNRALANENAALRTARDESQRSEQRYRLITENTLDLICEVSQHGFYTYVSPNHEEILGYRPKELLGHNFSTLIHGDDVAQVVERFSECIVAGIPFVCSFRLRHRDGSWHWVEVSAKPLESAHSAGGGSPYEGQAVFVYRDVTERRETRRALSAETERLKVTLSSITDGVISTDLAGGVVEANEAALHLIGLKRETLLGTSIDEHLEFVDEMTRMPVRSPVIRALTEAVPCTLPLSGHTLLRTKIGLEFAVAGSAAPIRDQEDQLVGSVLIFRNITEKRRTERELLKLSKQESLGQLAARIAHDFNNLLTVILGNLSLTKILPLALEPLVRESTRLILQDANVAYRLNWPDQLPQVNADAEQLHQLLYELLTNAMHATPIGGSIHVRGETLRLNAEGTVPLPEGDYVRLSVRDEGLGIPEQHLARIFEPFFSTKENARGLGLATCFLIARNHEGFMTVDSAPGFGTTFYLYLPALPVFAPAPVVSADPPWVAPAPPRRVSTIDEFSDPYAPMRVAPGAADTRRILVMDDEQPICELAAELLSREGYAVETALDGAEAIRKYQDARIAGQPYDVVILDLTVRGGMGGRETAMKLAEIDPGVRAIVSSGYSQDLMMSRFREFGFCGVVSKPYSVSELTQEIQQAIAGARK
jgi:PAS domain S-box-containing protein